MAVQTTLPNAPDRLRMLGLLPTDSSVQDANLTVADRSTWQRLTHAAPSRTIPTDIVGGFLADGSGHIELSSGNFWTFKGANGVTINEVTEAGANETLTTVRPYTLVRLYHLASANAWISLIKGTTILPIGVAASDETTALAVGTAKASFRMPFAMRLIGVRASVNVAPTGAALIVDINSGGTTLMTGNKLSIDATELTSKTAATAAVLTTTALADDALITIDIDQVGSTIAGAGLKVWLLGIPN